VEVTERARFHAALGDPVRLEIVDLLVLDDLSPSDLAAQLGLASNLVAHHLGVLEAAEVVRRTRSEGDARRSYVHLRTDNALLVALGLEPRLSPELREQHRVVFVCTRNSARSQLAASAWRQVSRLPACSAGTHPAAQVHRGALRLAKQRGLPLSDTRTRHLDEVVTSTDLLVAVCDQVYEELTDRPRFHWSIPDPVRRGRARDFESAFDQIVQRVGQLADALGTTGITSKQTP
jgi:protein-tyrosine-phosphatase